MANIEKRESADGKLSYRVKIRLKGYPTQTATFERLTDARKWIASTESAIREGRHFKTAEAKRHTLAEAIDRYTRDVLPKRPKQVRVQSAHFAWWRDRIGARLLVDVTPALLAECRDELSRDRAPATVVRYMAALSRLYSVAVREWGWVDDTPLRKVEKPVLPRGRVRFLTDDERAALLAACQESPNPYLYTVVVLALSTGARKGEILGLRWADADLNRGRAILHDTKNGDTRAVHLSGHALELLRDLGKLRRLDTDLLFPEKTRPGLKPMDLRAPWESALKRAGIEDFRFHDLRHSAASYLAMNGATLAEIAEVLGHRTLAMVKRYSHLSEAHVSSVVERMNAKIFG
ncbi:MAG: site-specific integrase [Methylococcus sp.]|nr:site-specific integrase [Methylococcus sp.]